MGRKVWAEADVGDDMSMWAPGRSHLLLQYCAEQAVRQRHSRGFMKNSSTALFNPGVSS